MTVNRNLMTLNCIFSDEMVKKARGDVYLWLWSIGRRMIDISTASSTETGSNCSNNCSFLGHYALESHDRRPGSLSRAPTDDGSMLTPMNCCQANDICVIRRSRQLINRLFHEKYKTESDPIDIPGWLGEGNKWMRPTGQNPSFPLFFFPF